MAKAYLVLCYHSASDEKALQEYASSRFLRYKALAVATWPVACRP